MKTNEFFQSIDSAANHLRMVASMLEEGDLFESRSDADTLTSMVEDIQYFVLDYLIVSESSEEDLAYEEYINSLPDPREMKDDV